LTLLRDGDSADLDRNSALANAIARAKSNGVPKANIQAALEQVNSVFFFRFCISGWLTWMAEATNIKGNGTAVYEYEALFAGKIGLIMWVY